MKKIISFRAAVYINIILMSMLILFHVLVLIGLVPSDIVWGGNAKDGQFELVAFELVSIFMLMLFITLTLLKAKYLKFEKFKILINIGVWFLFVFFLLNTVGNLFSMSLIEKLLFTPTSILLALSSLRLALEKDADIF